MLLSKIIRLISESTKLKRSLCAQNAPIFNVKAVVHTKKKHYALNP
jgi:hypothetical protein